MRKNKNTCVESLWLETPAPGMDPTNPPIVLLIGVVLRGVSAPVEDRVQGVLGCSVPALCDLGTLSLGWPQFPPLLSEGPAAWHPLCAPSLPLHLGK